MISGGKHEQPYVALVLERFGQVSREYTALDEHNLHQFRIACKRVRYLAELGHDKDAAFVVSEFKHVQAAIGEWHDLVTLEKRAQRLSLRLAVSPLVSVLRTLRNEKFFEALHKVEGAKHKLLTFKSAGHSRPVVRHC